MNIVAPLHLYVSFRLKPGFTDEEVREILQTEYSKYINDVDLVFSKLVIEDIKAYLNNNPRFTNKKIAIRFEIVHGHSVIELNNNVYTINTKNVLILDISDLIDEDVSYIKNIIKQSTEEITDIYLQENDTSFINDEKFIGKPNKSLTDLTEPPIVIKKPTKGLLEKLLGKSPKNSAKVAPAPRGGKRKTMRKRKNSHKKRRATYAKRG